MDLSAIQLILQTLDLNADDVTNIYHHGSWVYGTNSPTSDRDLLVVTRSSDKTPVKFWSDFDYIHDFKNSKLSNQYDVTIYTVENFETILEKNCLVAVQCVFLPDEFKIKEEIDFRKIYLEKYYNTKRIKQAGFYEMYRDWKLYKPENDSSHSSMSNERRLTRRNYVFKHFFHGLRYLDFVEQLIQTGSIHNFKRVSYLFDQMKDIRGDPTDESSLERVAEFVGTKSTELKSRLDALVATNIIQGSFKAYITFDCSHHTEQAIENLKKVCEDTRYTLTFIQLDINQAKNTWQQLMVSSHYDGEYPLIGKQIEEEAYQHFQDFNIIHIKIESLVSNEGIPESDIDKKLFWNRTNYFAFYYNVPLENDRKGENLKKILKTCRSKYGFKPDSLNLLRSGFKKVDDASFHYICMMRLFEAGREKAFLINDEVIEYSRRNNLSLTALEQVFIVYDKNIGPSNS